MSDADFYQAHKDDRDEWGEPERSPSASSRRLASMISVRFTPDEAQSVRAAARDAGESVSQFIRSAALRRARHGEAPVPSISGALPGAREVLWQSTWTVGGPAMSSLADGEFLTGDPRPGPVLGG